MNVLSVQTPRIQLEFAKSYLHELRDEIAKLDFELMVLPEKWLATPISTHDKEWTDLMAVFKEISLSHKATVIPGSYSIERDDGLYNSAPVIIKGRIEGFQDKIALFKNENGKYKNGKEIHVFDSGEFKFSVPVCYDLDFPYYAKLAVERGAQLLVNPSLVESQFSEMWYIYVKGRSLENRLPIISVNSISEPFGGGSIVTYLYPRNGGIILEPRLMGKEHFSIIQTNSTELEDFISARKAEDFGRYELRK